jgi:hypothetical protein
VRRGLGGLDYFRPGRIESVVGELRRLALGIIEHPFFDQSIMACIIANCVVLALADPTQKPADYSVHVKYRLMCLYVRPIKFLCNDFSLRSFSMFFFVLNLWRNCARKSNTACFVAIDRVNDFGFRIHRLGSWYFDDYWNWYDTD